MGIYFHRSVSAGPFRINFSSSGVGASCSPPHQMIPERSVADDRVHMVDIESGGVGAMHEDAFDELLSELKERRGRIALTWPLLVFLAAVAVTMICAGSPYWFLPVIAMVPAWIFLARFDASRRTTVLVYDLAGSIEQAYGELCAAFDQLSACKGKWHIPSAGRVTDLRTWKRNAGASNIVTRTNTPLTYSLPHEIKSNIQAPSIKVGRQTLHFLPDFMLVQDGRSLGAVSYEQLEAHVNRSNFIEDGRPPQDATIISYTWQHPNKNGGPDRRFSSNRKLPVCLYGIIWFRSSTGLQELLEFSIPERAEKFARAVGVHTDVVLAQRQRRVPSPAASK